MADLEKVSEVFVQFAYEEAPELEISQVFVQYAYEEAEVTGGSWYAYAQQ